MENTVSNKVRLLLNELAILNQPEVSGGKFIYNIDTLLRIKSLSAELYLLVNEQLEGLSGSATQLGQTQESSIKAEETPSPEGYPEIMEVEDNQIVDSFDEENTDEKDPITITESVEVELDQNTAETEPVATEPIADIIESHSEQKVNPIPTASENRFEGKISLTRRFEYVNNLFSGESDTFSGFLNAISISGSLEAAMQHYQKEYEGRNWRRKAETADDLKALIKKAF